MARPYLGVGRIFCCRHPHEAVTLAFHRDHAVVEVSCVAVLENHWPSALCCLAGDDERCAGQRRENRQNTQRCCGYDVVH